MRQPPSPKPFIIPPRRPMIPVARIEVEHHFPINHDFADDGGAPGWRERRGIPPRGFLARFRALSFGQKATLVVFSGAVLPFLILFGGIIGLAVWDALAGR